MQIRTVFPWRRRRSRDPQARRRPLDGRERILPQGPASLPQRQQVPHGYRGRPMIGITLAACLVSACTAVQDADWPAPLPTPIETVYTANAVPATDISTLP